MVLFVGNVLRSKGAAVLVEACALLARRGRSFSCYLVGRGRDERRVAALAARRGLAGRVVLAGARPFAELPDWYRACDVVALPSFSEGIPNVLREAAACGRPFVATRVGGIPEVAEASSSRLVAAGSAAELAGALSEALAGGLAAPSCGGPAAPIGWDESARRLAGALGEARARYEGRRSSPSSRLQPEPTRNQVEPPESDDVSGRRIPVGSST